MTPVPSRGDGNGPTFVVCLDCGKRFTYDWERMRRGAALAARDRGEGDAIRTPLS
jgi:hypothetical protein